MSFNFQSLPREIVDLCIDELGVKNDKPSRKALLACNQVSKMLSSRARHHLFRQISFTSDGLHKIRERLERLDLIMQPGGMAHCVKIFEVIIDSSRPQCESEFEDLLKDNENLMANVISKFSTLRKFSLAMTATPYKLQIHSVEWEQIGETLQCAIGNLTKQASLSVLHLGNLHGIPADFLDGTTLQHLHLAHTKFDGDAEPPTRINKSLGCVTINPTDCLDGIAGGFALHLSHIVTFSSSIFKREHLKATRTILAASADTLKTLQLDFYETFPTPLEPLNLSQLSELRNLSLTHTVTMPEDGLDLTTSARFDQDVEHIYGLLDIAAPTKTLRTIQLMVTSWQIYPGDNFFANPVALSKWHLIDKLLTSPKFPALLVVGLYLTLPILVDHVEAFDQKTFKKKVEDFFQTVLPTLAEEKRIKFVFEAQIVLFGWGDEQAANVLDLNDGNDAEEEVPELAET